MLRPKGKLIAVGGAEDKGVESDQQFKQYSNANFAELQVLRRIKNEMCGDDPHIEVITTASMIPDEVAANYIDAFDKLESNNVRIMLVIVESIFNKLTQLAAPTSLVLIL